MVAFFTYSQFHNKNPVVGSTYLRVNQLIKYWDEAKLYVYGDNPDVMIFQKVFMYPDYRLHEQMKCIKILDLCDPDWLEGAPIKATVDAVDAVTCSSQGLVDFIKQLTDKPVILVPDRFDLALIPKPRQHKLKAKSIVWFGYAHNAELLKPALNLINKYNLKLTVISNEKPVFVQYGKEIKFEHIKYSEDTIYTELQKHDFAILPKGNRPIDIFKSDNKTIKANLAGLPVAYDDVTLESYLDPKNRQDWFDNNYDIIANEYDVKNSIKQLKELIDEIKS